MADEANEGDDLVHSDFARGWGVRVRCSVFSAYQSE